LIGTLSRFRESLLLIFLAGFPCCLLAIPAPSILLISIDTLRADHLGSYGYPKALTPHLDALTRHGTLFRQVDSAVPMTLPAHLSLLTSTYPALHGVHENGQEGWRKRTSLPALLQARGYHTAAFIGGYVLDTRFGLNDGFEVYDSPFHLGPDAGEEPPEIKRPAEAVLGAAAQWLKAQGGHPFFAFIHLYDAHQPYAHGSYDSEIRYIDQALGHFLAARNNLENAVIVLTSDHGESLGEHGEDTHGYFIYESTLRVPLIIQWPSNSRDYAAEAGEPASLIDIAPTLLEFAGIPAAAAFQGHSLMRLLRPHPAEEPIYGESMYARDHLGCSPLRSVRVGRYKYIDAPRPELYDLDADPGELHNRYELDRNIAARLRARLPSLAAPGGQPPSPASPEVLARLQSLGYLSGSPASNRGVDPKDRLAAYARYGRAIHLANTGQLPEAIQAFERLLKENGQSTPARFNLAICYYRSRRLDDAVRALQATLAISPDFAPAGQLLGTIWLLKADYGRARQQFEHLARIAPGNFGAHYNLGILALRGGRTEDARRELGRALVINPDDAATRQALQKLPQARGQ